MTYCCSVFPKIAKELGWMYYGDGSANYPYMCLGLVCFTVNFCPHCGKDIRGLVITKEEFDKLK